VRGVVLLFAMRSCRSHSAMVDFNDLSSDLFLIVDRIIFT
jgi:hypothetical protein